MTETSMTESIPSSGRMSRHRWIVWGTLLGATLVMSVFALLSRGVDQDDEVTHFMIARSAWVEWRHWFAIWGRPGCTIPYSLVAWIGSMETGFMMTRLFTVFMSVGGAWLTYDIARKLGAKYPAAALAVLAMPFYFHLSYTCTTEMPAAIYGILAAWFWVRKRHWLGAIAFSMLPLTRHELAVFCVPIGIYFLWRKDIVAFLLLGAAEVIWNAVYYFFVFPSLKFIPINRFFTPGSDVGNLGSAGLGFYLLLWLAVCGGLVFIVGTWGTIAVVRREMNRRPWGHRAWLRIFVLVFPWALVGLEAALYFFNRFASGGYARFLVPVAPMMAVAFAFGVQAVEKFIQVRGGDFSRHRASRVAVSTVLVGAALAQLIQLGYYLYPLKSQPEQLAMKSAVAFMKEFDPKAELLWHTPWGAFYADVPLPFIVDSTAKLWANGTPGSTYYLYDLAHNYNYRFDDFQKVPSRLIKEFSVPERYSEPFLRIYQRLPYAPGEGAPPDTFRLKDSMPNDR